MQSGTSEEQPSSTEWALRMHWNCGAYRALTKCSPALSGAASLRANALNLNNSSERLCARFRPFLKVDMIFVVTHCHLCAASSHIDFPIHQPPSAPRQILTSGCLEW